MGYAGNHLNGVPLSYSRVSLYLHNVSNYLTTNLPAFLADQLDSTVLALNIEAAGHNVWVLEVYLLGI